MPFQVFRRHQRKLLALLAILAMFAFVLADSLPRLFSNYAQPTGQDEVVAEIYGRKVYQSDLNQLRAQRGQANYVLSLLAPYFSQETFGPTTEEAMVNAYILQKKADELGLPSSPEMAKDWIFEQARARHEYLRNYYPTLPPFDARALASQLETAFGQTYGQEMTDVQFLANLANQIRIIEALELLSQSMVTPLDAFQAYSDEQVRVEARYVAFPVEDYLDQVGEPENGEATLRAFFEEHRDQLPDPTTGQIGFRVPRRIKVEYLALGLNAIDILREQIRSQPIAEEIREESGFEEDVRAAYRDELQTTGFGQSSLPPDLFADAPELTPPPASFVHRYVEEQVAQRVDEQLRDRVEDIFEPVKEGMYDFLDSLEIDMGEVRTGLEPEIDRDAIPELDNLLGARGEELAEALGEAARRAEGINFIGAGLTRPLAEPETLREFLDVEGLPTIWRSYLALARLNWGDPLSRVLVRSLEGLVQGAPGLEQPEQFRMTETVRFPDELFAESAPLFEPREFTDPLGRRYLTWKTMDLPESARSFDDTPRELVLSLWRLDQARDLARKDAEALADRIRSSEEPPSEALAEFASDLDKAVLTTGARAMSDPLDTYAPIDAGEEVQRALFSLSPSGRDAAIVAPDRNRDTYYTFALASRRDTSLAATDDTKATVNYQNALSTLPLYRATADREAAVERIDEVMAYLRREAGLEDEG